MRGAVAVAAWTAVLWCVTVRLVGADEVSAEEQAVLEVIEQAFAAIGSGDVDALRKLQLAEGTTISFRPSPDGPEGALLMRMSSNEAFLSGMVATEDRYLERWTAKPEVRVRGSIATVWGEYEFLINEQFSHCGVDAVDLVQVEGRWTIANWMWTVEREGCSTASHAAE